MSNTAQVADIVLIQVYLVQIIAFLIHARSANAQSRAVAGRIGDSDVKLNGHQIVVVVTHVNVQIAVGSKIEVLA